MCVSVWRQRIGWGISLLVCFLLLSPTPLSEAETAEQWITIQYVHDGTPFQPVVLQANDEIDPGNPDLFFDQEGDILPALWPYLTPRLTDNHEVVNLDVSAERILLCLSKDGGKCLRIAQWNTALNDYTILDTGILPDTSELDTYHDADAVLVSIPFMGADTEEGEADECLFLTFQQVENSWYLTNFTDGQSFVAALCDDAYHFDDYYEPNPTNAWMAHDRISFEDFSVTELLLCVQEYQEAKLQCPISD